MLIPLIGGMQAAHFDEPVVINDLALYLDAGKSASYGGAGQSWGDLSGNGIHFTRGPTNGAETEDPVFVGTPGGLSAGEYFDFDSADDQKMVYLGTMPPWAKNANTDESAEWTVMMFVHHNGSGANEELISFATTGAQFRLLKSSTNRLRASRSYSTGSNVKDSTASIATGGWACAGFGYSAGENAYRFFADGVVESGPGNWTVASETQPTDIVLGAQTSGGAVQTLDGRLAIVLAWSRLLSEGEMHAIHRQYGPRFGL